MKRPMTGEVPVSEVIDLIDALDPSVVGAKAAALGHLKRAGFMTPDGFVIPTTMIGQSTPVFEKPESLNLLSEALARIGPGPFAVRSSGIAEDLNDASHAGQYETVLNVQDVHEVAEAIEMVIASAHHIRLEQYRNQIGSSTNGSSQIAVLIQPMLRPDSAGVAFSANPVTGNRNEIVINAVAGLADRLMDGEVIADELVVRHGTIQRQAANEPILSDEDARRVADLARLVETEQGVPQDIEWVIQNEDLYLLQARPITILPVKPDLPPPPPGYWTKEEEHFVAPVSPMFFSIHRSNIQESSRAGFEAFGLLIDCLDLHYRAGEVYETDIPLGGKKGEGTPPWWVIGILSRIIPAMRRRMRIAAEAVRTDREAQHLQRWDREWKHELQNTTSLLRQVDLTALSDGDLAQHLDALRELTRRGFYIHFQLAVPVSVPMYRLCRLCDELFDWDEYQSMRLLHGTSSESSAGSRDLDRLANEVRLNPRAMNLLTDSSTTIDRLEAEIPEIAMRIHTHLRDYGERMIQNDLMSPTFREVPSLTLQLLRDRLTGDAGTRQQCVDETRQAAEEEAKTLLAMRSANDRVRFEHTLLRARWAYGLRDTNVYLTLALPFALLRYGLLEAGERLANQGTLNSRDDVFYCTFDEVRAAIDGQAPPDMAQTARQRRLECLWTSANPGPAMFGTESPSPDVRGLPKEAREIHEAMLWAIARIRAPQAQGADGLAGVPASPGRYQGTVRVIRTEQEFQKLQPGDVLVCPSTSSSWAVLFGTAGALVTDQGGSLSHPAIIAREHGIPAVVATGRATKTLKDGEVVIVDGSAGRIELVEAR